MSRFRLAVPSGPLSLEQARIAVVSAVLASREGGKRVLFVDEEHGKPPEDLLWLGLSWEEGPYPPQIRTALAYLEKLTAENLVVPCVCPEGAPHRPGCASQQEREALRYRVRPPEGAPSVKVQDIVQGEITLPARGLSELVVADARRFPSREFTSLVENLSFGITDVVLTDDALHWAAWHTILGGLFGQPPPRFFHLVPLAEGSPNPSLQGLRAEGFLGSAVANALVLLGWTPPEDIEALSWDMLLLLYEPTRPSTPVLFDPSRLRSLNQAHLRALSFEELGEALRPFLEKAGMLSQERTPALWARLSREEISTLAEIDELAYLVDAKLAGPEHAPEEVRRVFAEPSAEAVLAAAEEILSRGEIDFYAIRAYIEARTGAKRKQLFFPLRAALTGRLHGPPLPEVLPFLGVKECQRRISSWRYAQIQGK